MIEVAQTYSKRTDNLIYINHAVTPVMCTTTAIVGYIAVMVTYLIYSLLCCCHCI